MNNIKEQVRQYLMENITYGVPIEGDDDTNLVETGVLSSFGSFDLAVFLDGAFNIDVPAEEITMENFATLNRIEQYVLSKPMKPAELEAA